MSRRWPTARLGDIVTMRSGKTPSRSEPGYWDGEHPWVSAKDMKTPVVVSTGMALTTEGLAASSTVPAGTVLILTRGMTLFRDVPVCLAGRPLAFNQDVKALLPMGGTDARYLAHYLRAKKATLLGLVDAAGHGTGRIDTEALANLAVILPPLREQRRIADVLSTWDDAIDKAHRLTGLARLQRDALARGLVFQPAAAGAWLRHPLRDLAQSVSCRNSSGVNRVLTSSARLGLVDQLTYFKKDVSGGDLSDYYVLRRGEFAYNRSSSEGCPFGAVRRLERHDEGVLSPLYVCFRLVEDRLSPDFLLHLFEYGAMNRELSRICYSGARAHGLLNVSRSDFLSLPVPVPPRAVQDRAVAILATASRRVEMFRDLAKAYGEQSAALASVLLGSGGDRP